jgi:O-antigen ligase
MIFIVITIAIMIYFSIVKPELALVLAMNTFIINAGLGFESGIYYNAIGAGLPFVFYSFCLLLKILRKDTNIFIPKVESILMLLFCLYYLCSGIYAISDSLALESSFRFVFLVAGFFFSIFILVRYSIAYSVNATFKAYLFFCVLTAIYAILANNSSSEYVMRLTIGNVSSIPLSIVIGQGVLISFYYLLNSTNKKTSLCNGGVFLFLFYTLALTNTRSTLIGCILALVFYLFLCRKIIPRATYIKLYMVIVFSIPLVISFMYANYDRFERIISGFSRIANNEYGESEGDRVSAWMYAIDLFTSNPVLGIGAGNFNQYYIAYPHNIFAELLSETGLVGFVLMFLLIARAFYCTFKFKKSEFNLLGALFAFNFFVSQVSLTLWMHKSLFIWMAFIFVVYYFYYEDNDKFKLG